MQNPGKAFPCGRTMVSADPHCGEPATPPFRVRVRTGCTNSWGRRHRAPRLVVRAFLEDEAECDVGLTVKGAELPAGGDLRHRPARVPERDAPEMRQTVLRAFRARGAKGRHLGTARRSRCKAHAPSAAHQIRRQPGSLRVRLTLLTPPLFWGGNPLCCCGARE